jgi:hypothetical protein
MSLQDSIERVDAARSDEVLAVLLNSVRGPAEAYAVLILAIYRINFEFHDKPLTLVELADSVSKSIRSIKKAPMQ